MHPVYHHPVRMKSFPLILLSLFAALLLSACNKDGDFDDRRSAAELYEDAHNSMEHQTWDRAIAEYKMLQTRYPFGRYTEQSMLDLAYCYYKGRQRESAISTLDRFLRTYPAHENIGLRVLPQGPCQL